jgi:hypothetical protein
MEVIMRRFCSCILVVANCYAAHAIVTAEACGNNQLRGASLFRALTSEQSQGAAMAANNSPTEEAPVVTLPTPTPSLSPAAPTSPGFAQSMPAMHTPRLVSFNVGNSARQKLSQFPRRAAIQAPPQRPMHRQSKPFENLQHEPTLSPYLNLDQDEDDVENVPNYFTLVRPRIEQLETNRRQQFEIQQLRGQIQTMATSPGAGMQQDAGRSAGMRTPARFMDTAQFYGGRR